MAAKDRMPMTMSTRVCSSMRRAGIATLLLALAPCVPAAAGVDKWTSQGPGGGYVYALAIDPATPATLYAGTAFDGGGVYKSTDGGETWTGKGAGLPGSGVYALAIDPAIPSTVYCGTQDGGVFKSTDGGKHWTGTYVGLDYGRIATLAIDPAITSTLYAGAAYASTGGGVFKSTDGGETWTAMNDGLTFPDVTALAIDRTNPRVLYAGTSAGVFKSTDGGGHWVAVNDGLSSLGVHALAIDPFDPNTLYAGGFGVYKSTDGGGHWTAVNNGLEPDDYSIPGVVTLAIDPLTPGTVYAGAIWGYGGVYKTTDGGAHWVAVDVGWAGVDAGLDEPDVRVLAIDPSDPEVIYAGTTDVLECAYYSAGVYKTTDGGDSWAASNTGLSSTSILALAIDPAASSSLWAGTATGGLAQTSDAAATWSTDGGDSSITALAFDPSAPSRRYLAFSACPGLPAAGLIRQDAGGSTDVSPVVDLRIRQVLIDPLTPATLYVATDPFYRDDGALYRSPDRGDTWTMVTGGLPETGVTVVAIDRFATLYAGTLQGIFRSTDRGDSWSAASSGLDGARITALAVDPVEPPVVYAGTTGGIFKTTNGGGGWFASGLAETSVTALAIDPRRPATVYAGTSGGVFKSIDGGASWALFNTGLESVHVRVLMIDPLHPSILYAATGRGVFKVTQVDPCVAGAMTMCLSADRFRVEVAWRSFDGTTGSGRVVPVGRVPLAPLRGDADSGLWWFFEADNWEMLVKVLDGCAINDRFWVFAAATTTVEYTLRVTDTTTGASAEYFNSLGNAAAAITDTGAFATCSFPGPAARGSLTPALSAWGRGGQTSKPRADARQRSRSRPSGVDPAAPGLKGACVPSLTRMCLSDDRFSAEVDWRDYAGNTGAGKVVGTGSASPRRGASDMTSGLFWFFNGANWEMLVKVLDACHLEDPRFLLLAAATTDVEYTLRVTDTETGVFREYHNPLGNAAAALVDTFETCP